jgi:hypothetical protein
VISGHRPGGWRTGGCATARSGSPYPGTRLLLDMGWTGGVISRGINLGKVPGTGFRPRAGTRPALANTPPIAQAAGGKDLTAGTVTIELRHVTTVEVFRSHRVGEMALLPDGKVLIAGGTNFVNHRITVLTGTELYTP